ncbi:MAG TPA: thioredoxin domain-containing protein [Thermoplasmata archaeon]|nr:thioredoxin domain-containing protein [Thermoplasmata archaeon]
MAEPSEPSSGPVARRLAGSSSVYLRAAAEQGIDWYPWGSEPFEVARRTGRPILLDIGASWCHWCHVMDETTYTDAEVGRLLRQHFVAVKVDRDEHPEVDRRYQRQVGALTGEGGWPLTGFLSPGGELFLGGTYFPPDDGHGRPGLRRVLREVARLWREEPETIRQNSEAIQASLRRMRDRRTTTAPDLSRFAEAVRTDIESGFDPVNAGFGTAPKFPHPTTVSFLLWDAFANGREANAERARETLLRMADGGMYDQVGGGFHRYSVDEAWHIPHFEKMGIDNAELLGAYVQGVQRFDEPRFEEVVRGTLGWAREVLASPEGGWGASQDADNAPGDDGNYFTWTKAELKAALDPDEYRLVARVFGVGTDGRMHHDPERNVLFRLLPVEGAAEGLSLSGTPNEALRGALKTLRSVRARRPVPTVDPALYASINGRFVGAFARAGTVLEEPPALAEARRAADRWLARAYDPARGIAHRLDRTGAKGFGLLEDQVEFARGLLELSVATSEPRYLEPAVRLLELMDREYRGEDGLFRDIAPRLYDGPPIGGMSEPSYPLEDSPHLSANAAAALAFLRVGELTHDDLWTEKARALLSPIAARIGGAGLFAAGSALASGYLTTDPASVVVEGSGPSAAALARAARRSPRPRLSVFVGQPPSPFSFPGPAAAASTKGPSRALVCFGTSCGPPVTDPAELTKILGPRRSPTAP